MKLPLGQQFGQINFTKASLLNHRASKPSAKNAKRFANARPTLMFYQPGSVDATMRFRFSERGSAQVYVVANDMSLRRVN